ncbi:hypothetical protein HYX08_02585 [Candidatus Woesearchaeota archaeon]|nr:hypothetical protein [Candidatus Woesearchaeota archaeon]
MSKVLEAFLGEYLELTIDHTTLAESIRRDGPFCYVGKLVAVDDHFALLNPAEAHRPEVTIPGRIYIDEVVKHLREHEKFQPRADISDVNWVVAHEAHIRDRVESIMRPQKQPVPLRAIVGVYHYRDA